MANGLTRPDWTMTFLKLPYNSLSTFEGISRNRFKNCYTMNLELTARDIGGYIGKGGIGKMKQT